MSIRDEDSATQMQALVNRALSDANVYLLVNNLDGDARIEYYSDNLNRLGYDFDQFVDGRDEPVRHHLPLRSRPLPRRGEGHPLFAPRIVRDPRSASVNSDREVVWAKITLTPMLGDNNRIRKIALIIQFPEPEQDLGLNYQKLLAVANRSHVVFSVRLMSDPYSFRTDYRQREPIRLLRTGIHARQDALQGTHPSRRSGRLRAGNRGSDHRQGPPDGP
ncbi:MAG: PAS domain-containing protein [Bacillus subtilis]|nr:PAS domain-containing protein [Bacillus subtilis]